MKTSVRVVHRKDRKYLVLRWRDPHTGKLRERSANTRRRREAERAAAILEHELATVVQQVERGWRAFRERYESEKLPGTRPGTVAAWRKAARSLEKHMAPAMLTDVTEDMISRYAAKLYQSRLSVASVATYIRTLRVALNWAARIFPDYTAPHVEVPKVPKRKMMKGRPVTGEEFERMLAATAGVVGRHNGPAWRFLLRGLYLSGLRLGEALSLHWTDRDKLHVCRIGARRPMFRIHCEDEKGGQDRLLPMAPDFVYLLRRVPDYDRVGLVFGPTGKKGEPLRQLSDVSKTIARIGKAANVKVGIRVKRRTVDGQLDLSEVPKYATAHDLRRAFGERWAGKVMPFDLQHLMRHENIETTQKYYVGRNAQRTADAMWKALEGGDQIGDIDLEQPKHERARET